MKRMSICFFIVILVAVFMSGCAGHRSAHLKDTEGGIKHSDTNISLVQPSVGPREMSQAKIDLAIADQIKNNGQAAEVAGEYVGVIINQDTSRNFYFHHPSRNAVISIAPGRYKAFRSTEIPDYIHGRFGSEKENERYKTYEKTKVYNGIKTDFGARVQYD